MTQYSIAPSIVPLQQTWDELDGVWTWNGFDTVEDRND